MNTVTDTFKYFWAWFIAKDTPTPSVEFISPPATAYDVYAALHDIDEQHHVINPRVIDFLGLVNEEVVSLEDIEKNFVAFVLERGLVAKAGDGTDRLVLTSDGNWLLDIDRKFKKP